MLAGALGVWAVSARIEAQPGALEVRASGTTLRIVAETPHGWAVFRDAHRLGAHAGLPGLLRTLRQELAPGVVGGRLIIGSQSLS